MSASPVPSALHCHAVTPCTAVRKLAVQVKAAAGGRLVLSYTMDADMQRLRIPAEAPAQRADALWMHTCFEAFLRVADAEGYWELNFAPSRAWAIYRFSAHRRGMQIVTDARAPEIAVHRGGATLVLDASVCWTDFIAPAPRLRVAAAAVLEDEAGSLSYWALRHPSGQPDFHHAEGFVLEVDL